MSKRKKGFTLVEVMIVVLVLAILGGIAIPQLFKARENSNTKTCVSNLRKISEAKQQFVMANQLGPNDFVEPGDLAPNYIRHFPECPSGGFYAIQAADLDPACSTGGRHALEPAQAVTVVNSGGAVSVTVEHNEASE